MRITAALFCFLVLNLATIAQQSRIDSLEKVLEGAQDEEYLPTLTRLGWAYMAVDPQESRSIALEVLEKTSRPLDKGSALRLLGQTYEGGGAYDTAETIYREALEIFLETGNKKEIANSYSDFGKLEFNQSRHESAIGYFEKALAMLTEIDDKVGMNTIMNNIGGCYIYMDKLEKAVEYYHKCAELNKELGNEKGLGVNYYNLAIGHENLNQDDKAIEYLIQSAEIRKNLGDDYGLASVYNSMGVLHMKQEKYDEAMEFYGKGLELFQKMNRKSEIANIYNNMGVIYVDTGDFDKALEYHQKSLKIKEELGDRDYQSQSLANIGEVYQYKGDIDKALDYYHEALAIKEQYQRTWGINLVLNKLGEIYTEKGDYQRAEQYLRRSLDSANYSRKRNVFRRLSELYEAKGEHDKALDYYKQFIEIRDSVESEDRLAQIDQLQTQFQAQEKDLELSLLNKQAEVDELWRKVLVVGLVILAIMIILVWFYLRQRSLKNKAMYKAELQERKHLQEVDHMKSRFFANISHELRTPLTLISGPVDDMIQNPDSIETDRLKIVQRNTRRLLKLINQLLDLSKIESGKMSLKTSQVNIIPLVKGIVSSFESMAQQQRTELKLFCEVDEVNLYVEKEKFEDVLVNLVGNALKFTKSGGKVWVYLETTGKEVKIRVKDTGVGISQDQLPYIFDRFFQTDNSDAKEAQGSGIGLSIAREYVELHQGRIEVSSVKGEGTEFTVSWPLGKEHLSEDQITPFRPESETFFPEQIEERTGTSDQEAGSEMPLILLAEDNPDMRVYIQDHLKAYRVILAENGVEALKLTEEEMPDLILSDVMMPEMDGIELCQKVRASEKINHIPIVLLTAKASERDKLEGLSVEADAYLVKPFNPEELQIWIQNLIRVRQKLQSSLGSNLMGIGESVNLQSRQEVFLNKAVHLIDQNISDEQFGVGELADSMAMSKSQLNRKLKQVLNQSPNQFIRKYRLEKARQMIQSDSGTISEIAFKVGFSSPAYFTKCFVDEFGYTPNKVKI